MTASAFKCCRNSPFKLLLADAIDHFRKHVVANDQKGRKLFQETEEWFLEKDSDGLFCFEYICDTSQLRPDYIPARLAVLEESQGARKVLFKGIVRIARSL